MPDKPNPKGTHRLEDHLHGRDYDHSHDPDEAADHDHDHYEADGRLEDNPCGSRIMSRFSASGSI